MSSLYLLVRIDRKLAALDSGIVDSVIEIDEIFPVPGAPEHVSGITAVRSQSLTVIDACRVLGVDRKARGERAVVFRSSGHSYALNVDFVEDVVEVTSSPEHIAGGYGAAWRDASAGLLETPEGPAVLLDPVRMIDPAESRAA